MMTKYTKPIIAAVVSTALLSITACSGGSDTSSKDAGALSVAWWGSQDRNNYTVDLLKQFEKKNSKIKVTPQFTGWDGYWAKMSTQFAGGSAPDVLQMDRKYLRSYAERGALMNFDETNLDLSKLDEESLATGEVNDELYAIPTGVNAIAMFYDPAILKEAGIKFDPTQRLTWSKFADIAKKVSKELPDTYGAQNIMDELSYLKYYARDKGEQLYSEDMKSMAVSTETVADWFRYWLKLQEQGVTPPAQVSASVGHGEIQDYPLVKQQAAFGFAWSSQYTALKGLMNRPLGMTMFPHLDSGNHPYFLKPSMYWSISKETSQKSDATKLVDYLINSAEASKLLGTERGVPINEDIRAQVKSRATKMDEKVIDFVSKVSSVAGEAPPVDPTSTSRIIDLFTKIAQQVQFKKLTPDEAAAKFVDQASSILSTS